MQNKIEDQFIRIITSEYCRLDDIVTLPPDHLVELDLGCGKGTFTVQLAQRFPDRTILAADVMIGRLRRLTGKMNRNRITNLHLLRVEARMLVGLMIPDRTLHRLHIICPDPWPKGSQRHNRLLCSDFMTHIHRVLSADGMFHFATDDPNYLEAVTGVVEQSGLFTPCPEAMAELAGLRSDFEARWLSQGKSVEHHLWKRRDLVRPEDYRGH